MSSYMLTLPDYLGVYWIRHWSPALPYGSHQIYRIKWTFELFCAFVSNLARFFPENLNIFYSLYSFWEISACSLTKIILSLIWRKRILITCTSCKTSYNVLSRVNLWTAWRWWGCCHSREGGVVQNRESPDFNHLQRLASLCNFL